MKTAEQMHKIAYRVNGGDAGNKKIFDSVFKKIESAAKKGQFSITINFYREKAHELVCGPVVVKLRKLGYRVNAELIDAPPIVGREDEAYRKVKISW